MNKKGFTLMELLVVIVIIAVVGVASTISFSNVDDETAKTERENLYVEIQRSASLYLDLHDKDLENFLKNKNILISFYSLMEENYISFNTKDPVTGEKIDQTNAVILYVDTVEDNGENKDMVSGCIVDANKNCIAGPDGKNECPDKCLSQTTY